MEERLSDEFRSIFPNLTVVDTGGRLVRPELVDQLLMAWEGPAATFPKTASKIGRLTLRDSLTSKGWYDPGASYSQGKGLAPQIGISADLSVAPEGNPTWFSYSGGLGSEAGLTATHEFGHALDFHLKDLAREGHPYADAGSPLAEMRRTLNQEMLRGRRKWIDAIGSLVPDDDYMLRNAAVEFYPSDANTPLAFDAIRRHVTSPYALQNPLENWAESFSEAWADPFVDERRPHAVSTMDDVLRFVANNELGSARLGTLVKGGLIPAAAMLGAQLVAPTVVNKVKDWLD